MGRVKPCRGLFVTDRETFSAFGATAGQYLAAVRGFHALAKAVFRLALAVVWLKRSLHSVLTFRFAFYGENYLPIFKPRKVWLHARKVKLFLGVYLGIL